MATHKWSDIRKATLSPERIARNHAAAMATVLELELRELREMAGKTQVETAAAAEMAASARSSTIGAPYGILKPMFSGTVSRAVGCCAKLLPAHSTATAPMTIDLIQVDDIVILLI